MSPKSDALEDDGICACVCRMCVRFVHAVRSRRSFTPCGYSDKSGGGRWSTALVPSAVFCWGKPHPGRCGLRTAPQRHKARLRSGRSPLLLRQYEPSPGRSTESPLGDSPPVGGAASQGRLHPRAQSASTLPPREGQVGEWLPADRCKGKESSGPGGRHRDTRREGGRARRRAGRDPRPPGRRRLPHALHGPGRARLHDRVDGRPADRRRPRRLLRLLVAVLRLSARRDGHPARLRQALRHLRPQAGADRRLDPLPPRLPALRAGLEHGRADRVPDRPGPRRRRPPGHGPDPRRRPLPARTTPQDPGQAVHGLGHLGGRGPGARRGDRRLRRLALDLPHQPAARRGRALAADPPPPRAPARTEDDRAPPHRLGRRAHGLRLRRRTPDCPGPGRGGLAMALAALDGPVRYGTCPDRRPRPHRTPGRRTDHPRLGLAPPHDRRREPRTGRAGPPDGRPDGLPPDVRAVGARPRPDRRRIRALRMDVELAGLGGAQPARLPSDRLPQHGDDRHRHGHPDPVRLPLPARTPARPGSPRS